MGMAEDAVLSGAAKLVEREEPKVPVNVKWPFKTVKNRHLIVQIDNFKYQGRILIPDKAKRSPTKGIVVMKADDIEDIAIGDKILYSQFAGYLLKFDSIPLCRVITYDEVLATLNDDAPELESEGT